MDLFEEWLNKKESKWIQRALTDSSYKNYIKHDEAYQNGLNDEPLDNTDLALLGDAVIKLIYSDYYLDTVDKITQAKSAVESDKTLVEIVAKHYDLIPYIKKDKLDPNRLNDYDYDNTPGKNNNRHKYIATCVEAMIGAIYKEKVDFEKISELVISWVDFKKPCNPHD